MKRTVMILIFSVLMLLCLSLPVWGAEAPSVTASGAAVLDYETGEFYYGKAIDTTRPIASMTKVMSVYLVFEEIKKGNLSPDTMVTASSYAAGISNNAAYSGHEQLVAGNQYKVRDLLRVVLTASCNGSMIALAEHISGSESAFVSRMNAKASDMGINAHFGDCCGITSTGNAVTPRAMAVLAQKLIEDHPEVLAYTSLKSTTFNGKTFNSTNSLLKNGSVPGIDGLKTGTTKAAGYCYTATAARDGRRIIAVVMNAGSSSARFSDGKVLLEYGFALRGEREIQWAQAEKMQWSLSYEPQTVLPLQAVTLNASVSGIDPGISIPCSEQWLVNGKTVSGTEKDVTLTSSSASAFTYTPSMNEKSVQVTYQLRFPGGDLYTAQKTVAVADPPKDTYTVRWQDEDGTLLEEDRGVSYGTSPSYDSPNPVKTENDEYQYTFAGWDKTLSPVLENVTYTARYTQMKKGSATVTFRVKNGTWDDGTTTDRTETIPTLDGKGTLPGDRIPAGMKPAEGYRTGAWDTAPDTAVGGISGNVTYTYTFQLIPHEETCPAKDYKDVKQTAWYHEAVDYALTRGIMKGTGATKFEPNTALSRGMLVTILYRQAGEPSVSSDDQGAGTFYDVSPGAWYENAVDWAASCQVVSGYGDGRFGPSDPITREQFATILYRFTGLREGGLPDSGSSWNLTMYLDADAVSEWAWEGLRWANNAGIITGKTQTSIAPHANATRAEAAMILMRYEGR